MAVTSTVKEMNLQAIRRYLFEKKEGSLSDIAHATGLSIPTVTRLTAQLMEGNELIQKIEEKKTGGRMAALFALNANYTLTLMLRIEKNEVNWWLKNLCQETLDSGTLISPDNPAEMLKCFLEEKKSSYPTLKIVTAGIAAPVSHGVIISSAAFPELIGFNLEEYLKSTGLEVILDNDMNILVLGRYPCCKENEKTLSCLYLGPAGFGAGTIFDGKLLQGKTNFAGELSFLPIHGARLNINDLPSSEVDITKLYSQLVITLSSILNPDCITLYQHPWIQGKLEEIKLLCLQHLPAHSMPRLEMSNSTRQDYERGLYALFRSKIDEGGTL